MKALKISFISLLSLLSGASIMAIELCCGKMFEPRLGVSITLWASVIGFSMLGLALGYLYYKKVEDKSVYGFHAVLLLSSLLLFFTPALYSFIFNMFESQNIKVLTFVCTILCITPNLFLLGMVSPIIILRLSDSNQEMGKNAGFIFSLSTLGGIVSILFFGLYVLPYWGISFGFKLLSGLILICFLFSFALKRTSI